MKKVLNILLAFVAFTSGVGAYHFTEVQDFTVDFVSQFEEEKVELSASVIKEEFVQKDSTSLDSLPKSKELLKQLN